MNVQMDNNHQAGRQADNNHHILWLFCKCWLFSLENNLQTCLPWLVQKLVQVEDFVWKFHRCCSQGHRVSCSFFHIVQLFYKVFQFCLQISCNSVCYALCYRLSIGVLPYTLTTLTHLIFLNYVTSVFSMILYYFTMAIRKILSQET